MDFSWVALEYQAIALALSAVRTALLQSCLEVRAAITKGQREPLIILKGTDQNISRNKDARLRANKQEKGIEMSRKGSFSPLNGFRSEILD